MVRSADALALPFDVHGRHLSKVWNRRQLAALTECCELLLHGDHLTQCDPYGRRLVIFDGPAVAESVVGAIDLKRTLSIAFQDGGDELPSHLYFTGSRSSIQVWQSVLPEHRGALKHHSSHERLFTHMSYRTQVMAQVIRTGNFQTIFLVSPWEQLVLFSAYLLRRLSELGLKGNQVKLVPVPYGDMTDRELGAKAFGEDGLYAEQWRQACDDRRALPEAGPYFPSELRDRLEGTRK